MKGTEENAEGAAVLLHRTLVCSCLGTMHHSSHGVSRCGVTEGLQRGDRIRKGKEKLLHMERLNHFPQSKRHLKPPGDKHRAFL